ncbi:helix-turn-helix domain-containing protein [Lysobacter sp. CA199]|uniref:helix-turn-helix domain-containing protein n=1 Tax=Lysobacter sp. CA199 TaxID=3455608 RepID=UPI003F8D09C4
MNTPGERLKAERKRLGYSQEAFGALGGVKKLAQIKYEQGGRKPDAAYFEGIAAAGADIAYILTGQTPALRQALGDVQASTQLAVSIGGTESEVSANQVAIFEQLRTTREANEAEHQLLKDYRCCSPEDQAVLRQMASRFAAAKSNQIAPAQPARVKGVAAARQVKK